MTTVTEEELRKAKSSRWTNRTRVLVFCSRGASYRDRHLMNDLKTMLPHSKNESKMDKRESIGSINEICEMKNCSKCVYFENRKKKDLYMWAASVPRGPTVKFLVKNVHTMMELKLTGNCLKGSRPLLSFDTHFSEQPFLALIKETLTHIFSVPNNHPRSKPFTDHILTFSWHDSHIWFRNYQVVDPDIGSLEEIGPRMTLCPIMIQGGSFGGPILYRNAKYVSPNLLRRRMRLDAAEKSLAKKADKISMQKRRKENPISFKTDPLDEVFQKDPENILKAAADESSASTTKELQKIVKDFQSSRKRKPATEKKRIRNRRKLESKIPDNSNQLRSVVQP